MSETDTAILPLPSRFVDRAISTLSVLSNHMRKYGNVYGDRKVIDQAIDMLDAYVGNDQSRHM